MDSSFQLLSSMSPKINNTSRHVPHIKAPRLLALKKNVRRSSNFCNLRNSLALADSIIFVESSTTESIDTEDSNSEINVINTTPIVISDSEDEKYENETKSSTTIRFNKSKLLTITDWVKDVNLHNQLTPKICCDNSKENTNIFNFDDVLENLPNDNTSKATLGDNERSISNKSNSDLDSSVEFRSKILDELYDNTWKNSKYDLLQKSVPNIKKISTKVTLPTTDIKRNHKQIPISPWTERLQGLCDSDTSDDNNVKTLPVRLRFDSDDDESSSKNMQRSSRSSERKSISDVSDNTDVNKKIKKLVKKKTENNRIEKKDDNVTNKSNKENKKKTKKKINNDICLTLQSSALQSNQSPKSVLRQLPLPNTDSASKSFLASLSGNVKHSQCDPSARLFRNNFQGYKTELLTRLFKLYNEKIFENKIHDDTPLEWNDKMRGTAGYCYCRKITRRTGVIERKARIVLSTKVVDSCDRLRDTLIHEMCHAATWIINEVANGHGNYWKAWAIKAVKTFPELPSIKRCHDYVINTKYTYRCVDCGYSIGRHSKSLDIERKRCGYCYGKFEVLINKTNKDGETKSVPVTPNKPLTPFALFVKNNYAIYKTPQLSHAQVMKLLGQKFNEVKVSI